MTATAQLTSSLRRSLRTVTGEGLLIISGRDRDLEVIDKSLVLVAANGVLAVFVYFGPAGLSASPEEAGRALSNFVNENVGTQLGYLGWVIFLLGSSASAALSLVSQVLTADTPRAWIRTSAGLYGLALASVVLWLGSHMWVTIERMGIDQFAVVILLVAIYCLFRVWMSARRFDEGAEIQAWIPGPGQPSPSEMPPSESDPKAEASS